MAEAHILSMQQPNASDASVDFQPGVLKYHGGAQRGLAAFINWIGICDLASVLPDAAFAHPKAVSLIQSLLDIHSLLCFFLKCIQRVRTLS